MEVITCDLHSSGEREPALAPAGCMNPRSGSVRQEQSCEGSFHESIWQEPVRKAVRRVRAPAGRGRTTIGTLQGPAAGDPTTTSVVPGATRRRATAVRVVQG